MVKTDIEIAHSTVMKPIEEIARVAGIGEEHIERYGKYKAKLSDKLWEKITKDCKNWQQKAPHVHALLTDLRKEMYTYSINEYHLYMSKVLLWMEENEEE